jgi:phospholipase/carboxylesterase
MEANRDFYKKGHLTARPENLKEKDPVSAGVQLLCMGGERDGFIYVPKNYQSDTPASLAVMFHGSGGIPEHGLSYIQNYADEYNILIIAPASQAHSWDIIAERSFDRDVIYLDQALALVFENFNINPHHIAIGGFSDGASYALSVGLSNGDLFSHILAFSPGFVYTMEKTGKPEIFISHGTGDRVLPIDRCSRQLVPKLQHQGYTVNYQEFEGEHSVPDFISQKAVQWLCA